MQIDNIVAAYIIQELEFIDTPEAKAAVEHLREAAKEENEESEFEISGDGSSPIFQIIQRLQLVEAGESKRNVYHVKMFTSARAMWEEDVSRLVRAIVPITAETDDAPATDGLADGRASDSQGRCSPVS